MSLREWRDFARRHPEVRIGARARARARRIIAQWKSRKPFNTGSYFYNRLLEVDCTEQELEFALAAPSHSRLSRMMRDKHPDPVVRPLNDWAEDALVRFTSGKFGFLALVKPWFGAALNDFHDDFMEMSKCAGGEILKDHKKLLDRAAATLASRLFEIIQGVCVLEQNVALLKRKLHGLTGDLRAKSFYLLLSKRKVRSEVLTEYPVILPLVINAIHEWRTTTCEFLSRLMHDYRQLCDTFNWTQFEGHLEGWEESQGDRHCGGRLASKWASASCLGGLTEFCRRTRFALLRSSPRRPMAGLNSLNQAHTKRMNRVAHSIGAKASSWPSSMHCTQPTCTWKTSSRRVPIPFMLM